MNRVQHFRLPDLGEGLTEAEILRWRVEVGDEVTLNQVIVEVETAKAAVEVPSPYAGTVHQIHVRAGETADVGTPIISVDTDPSAGPLAASDTVPVPPISQADPQLGAVAPGGRTANLVGYGPRTAAPTRRPRADRGADVAAPVLAKPLVRRLGRELGVDLSRLTGSGPGGTISRTDVEQGARTASTAPDRLRPGWDPLTRETRIPVRGIRKHTAAAMVSSAFTAPHVTEFLTCDVTPTMEMRRRVRAMPEFADVKAGPLLFVAKALLLAVRRHPAINSSWDEAAQEIVVKDDVHLGIAASTPRGLVVPTVKGADRLSLVELARELQALAQTAREGRTAPAALTGGTITITNVGAAGVDSGTPILVPGQAAILCLGAIRPMPWVVDGQVVVRQVTQLSLSFDHRMVDGQLGGQFLADLAAVLADPTLAMIWS